MCHTVLMLKTLWDDSLVSVPFIRGPYVPTLSGAHCNVTINS